MDWSAEFSGEQNSFGEIRAINKTRPLCLSSLYLSYQAGDNGLGNDHSYDSEKEEEEDPIGEWDQFDAEILRPVVCDLEESESSDLSHLGVAGVVIRWIILLLMCWKSRYAVSDGAIESIFAIFFTLFS